MAIIPGSSQTGYTDNRFTWDGSQTNWLLDSVDGSVKAENRAGGAFVSENGAILNSALLNKAPF